MEFNATGSERDLRCVTAGCVDEFDAGNAAPEGDAHSCRDGVLGYRAERQFAEPV